MSASAYDLVGEGLATPGGQLADGVQILNENTVPRMAAPLPQGTPSEQKKPQEKTQPAK